MISQNILTTHSIHNTTTKYKKKLQNIQSKKSTIIKFLPSQDMFGNIEKDYLTLAATGNYDVCSLFFIKHSLFNFSFFCCYFGCSWFSIISEDLVCIFFCLFILSLSLSHSLQSYVIIDFFVTKGFFFWYCMKKVQCNLEQRGFFISTSIVPIRKDIRSIWVDK